MRILKVRFKNLNSLAGEWQIDFSHSAFQEDGIFLITGPTGAGKTTILDAITLALYGKTPRVTPTGTRNEVMTRNSRDCLAEVHFETPKGRFRSYWGQITNKKGEPSKITRELENEDTQAKPEKNGLAEFMRENEIMDYEQFSRSILLAQGQFAAFLKADDDAKAAILEKLTDTSIYSNLSRLAWQTEKQEREKKEKLEEQDRQLNALEPQERLAKTEGLRECGEKLAALARTRKTLDARLQWLDELGRLQATSEKHRQDLASLRNERQEFEPQKAVLQAARSAAELVPQYELLTTRRKERANVSNELAEKRSRLAALNNILQENAANENLLQQAATASQAKFLEAQPLLNQARTLDKAIVETELEQKKRFEEQQALQSTLASARADYAQRTVQLAEAEKKQTDINAWLSQNARDEWLVTNYAALAGRIKARNNIWKQIGEAEKKAATLNKSIAEKNAELEEQAKGISENETRDNHLAAILNDLEARKSALFGGRTLQEIMAEAAALKSMEEHRKNLKSGEPCPLCGSLTHPFIRPDASDATLETREHDLEKLIADLEQINGEIEKCKNERSNALNNAKIGKANLESLKRELELLRSQLQDNLRETGQARNEANTEEMEIRSDLEKLGCSEITGFDTIMEQLEKRMNAWQAAEKSAQDIEKKRAELQTSIATLAANLKNAETQLREKEEALANLAETLSSKREERIQLFAGGDANAHEKRLKEAMEQSAKALQKIRKDIEEAKATLDHTQGALSALEKRAIELEPAIASIEKEFQAALAQRSWSENEFLQATRPGSEIERLQNLADRLERRETEISSLLRASEEELSKKRELRLTDKNRTEVESDSQKLDELLNETLTSQAHLKRDLEEDNKVRQQKDALGVQLAAQRETWRRWQELSQLIGSEDGKKFRVFAQNITLDLLLAHANAQLAKIRDRYTLRRARYEGADNKFKHYLDIEVVDAFHANQARPIANLSGGETFIVSLALSLGLASMAGKQALMGSLFLDEGFGSLDDDTLRTAMDVISSLTSDGKLIGIISHVEAMKERIPAQIHVEPGDMGKSTLRGPGIKP